MKDLISNIEPRFRVLSTVIIVVALFAVGWWAADAAGLISDGSNQGDAAVVIEPIHTPSPTAARSVETPGETALPSATSTATDEAGIAATDTPAPEPTNTPADAAPTVEAPTAIAPVPTATTPPSPPPPPPPPTGSLADVRIWSDGDSTSYFMSVSFIKQAVAAGAIATQPEAEYKISSGLLRPEFFNWPGYIASEMAAKNPGLVVFMIGANDAYVGMPLDVYHQRVGSVMDQLSDRRVIWVGQPNMGRADLAASVPAMNEVFAAEAASRPWVRYVDSWALTSDATGAYAQYLPDEAGVSRQIRADDGVHLTPEGGRRLANAVIAAALASN